MICANKENTNETERFNQLFKCYEPVLYKHAYAMTRSRWHAEEIVQDVFLRVWVHRERLESVRDINAWLFIIVRRLVFDYVRRESRSRKLFSSYKFCSSVADGSDSLLPVACRRMMDEAVATLTPREREVYYLKHVEGLNRAAIAKRLRIAEMTAVHYIKGSMWKVRKFVYGRLRA